MMESGRRKTNVAVFWRSACSGSFVIKYRYDAPEMAGNQRAFSSSAAGCQIEVVRLGAQIHGSFAGQSDDD
jgi:hypothetical protein